MTTNKEEKERELKWQTERDFETLMEYQKLLKKSNYLVYCSKNSITILPVASL